MNNLLKRSLTGLVFILLIIGAIMGGPYLFSPIFLVFSLLAIREFYAMLSTKHHGPSRVWGMISGAALYLLFAYASLDHEISMYKLISMMIPIFLLSLIIELYRDRPEPVVNVALNTISSTYIALPFALLNFMNHGPLEMAGQEAVLGFFILVWTNDTAAYCVGSLIGRTKLAPKISPNKTIEGFGGAVVLTLGMAWGISWFLADGNLALWLVTGAIVVSFGTLGDLVESMIKRSYGVKDASKIMPGHGGVLDRFDGVLLACPAVLSLFYWMESL